MHVQSCCFAYKTYWFFDVIVAVRRWILKSVFTHLNIVPFRKTFVTRKMSTIFKSGLYSTFSYSTITNKKIKISK